MNMRYESAMWGKLKIVKSYEEVKKYYPAFLGIIAGNLYFKGGRIFTLGEAKEKGLLGTRLREDESLDDYCLIGQIIEDIPLKNDPFPRGRYQGLRVFYEVDSQRKSL